LSSRMKYNSLRVLRSGPERILEVEFVVTVIE